MKQMNHSSSINGDQIEISLKGKFTFDDSKTFNSLLEDINKGLHKVVSINFKMVEFIDSAALGTLLLIKDKCDQVNTELIIKNPNGQVKQMFDISRFVDLFQIVND